MRNESIERRNSNYGRDIELRGLHLTLNGRRALCAFAVWLDGDHAVISGPTDRYATITNMEKGYTAKFSWEVVEEMVQGGSFQFLSGRRAGPSGDA